MDTPLEFDPKSRQLTGPAGSLQVPATDLITPRLLMLLEGQCINGNIALVAQKHGYCRQRYYQLLHAFQEDGLAALRPQTTGPKTNYRRTDQAVRQVLRYLFLDPDASPEVITQKLRQTHFSISLRSVQRIIADYGLQKKTLRTQAQKYASPSANPARRKSNPPATNRRSKPGTGGAPTSLG